MFDDEIPFDLPRRDFDIPRRSEACPDHTSRKGTAKIVVAIVIAGAITAGAFWFLMGA